MRWLYIRTCVSSFAISETAQPWHWSHTKNRLISFGLARPSPNTASYWSYCSTWNNGQPDNRDIWFWLMPKLVNGANFYLSAQDVLLFQGKPLMPYHSHVYIAWTNHRIMCFMKKVPPAIHPSAHCPIAQHEIMGNRTIGTFGFG